jgi:hypothetical protein
LNSAERPAEHQARTVPDPRMGWGLKHIWALLLAAALQRLPFALIAPDSLVGLKKALLISSYLLLVWALLSNLHLRSIRLVLLGVLFNLLAILANGGLMPVSPGARHLAGMTELGSAWLGHVTPQGTGVLLTVDHTRLWAFTDIIPWHRVGAVFSVGDVLLGLGLVWLLVELLWRYFGSRPQRVVDAGAR